MERISHSKKTYKVVSLFSGIGGLDLGFDNAGFDVIWANDFDKYAVQTYKANISENIVHGDIRLEKENIPKHDVLIGGFPCQPFSTLGKLKGFDDESRGTLFFEIKTILQKHNTKIVVLENVKNLINHDKGNTFKRILNELDEIGYRCHYQILNTADFGIPQRRNRVFIVGFNVKYFKNAPFDFPSILPLEKTTQDLLDKDVDEKYFLTPKIAKTILGTGTKGYKVKPTIDLKISKTLTATMHKMHRASQDNYVTDKSSRNQISNSDRLEIRKLTTNECRLLQGFPDDWEQVVSDAQAYKQFGNAVTVDVAYYLASKIINYIERNKKKTW
jgi:DNA (cytosine-5)-methyltransferase 1